MPEHKDTICALATPAGKGGIGIVRVSGQDALNIAVRLLGFQPQPRHAHYAAFRDADGETLDMGIALSFPGPDSFTGEDVIEFQAHGGPFVLDMLLREVLRLGARLARPGEFSERAFLNDKIDLAQAEAIADLIDSHSEAASRFAMKSLQGEFSNLINKLLRSIKDLRIYIEAAIDFPEEEIDFLSSGHVAETLQGIQEEVQAVLAQARLGSIMKEGLAVVIAGEPNAGKSSLLNLLAGQERAIVTEIAGTTRDLLREHISIDGLPLNIIDTAGLRESTDPVEQEGIRRAWDEIKKADLILLIRDSNRNEAVRTSPLWQQLSAALPDLNKLLVIDNKIDLSGLSAGPGKTTDNEELPTLRLSVKSGAGVDELRTLLKQKAGYSGSEEGGFIARRRHLDALQRAQQALDAASEQLQSHKAGELMAEDLRLAQNCLSEITGKFSSDDLLGEIFSSFCIGK